MDVCVCAPYESDRRRPAQQMSAEAPYIVLAEETGGRRPYLAQFVECLAGTVEAGVSRRALHRVDQQAGV